MFVNGKPAGFIEEQERDQRQDQQEWEQARAYGYQDAEDQGIDGAWLYGYAASGDERNGANGAGNNNNNPDSAPAAFEFIDDKSMWDEDGNLIGPDDDEDGEGNEHDANCDCSFECAWNYGDNRANVLAPLNLNLPEFGVPSPVSSRELTPPSSELPSTAIEVAIAVRTTTTVTTTATTLPLRINKAKGNKAGQGSKIPASRRMKVGDLKFIRLIGQGSSGKVFLVRDQISKRKLALKVIPKSDELEGEILSLLFSERALLRANEGCPWTLGLEASWTDSLNYYIATVCFFLFVFFMIGLWCLIYFFPFLRLVSRFTRLP